ncbi:MAG: hypothetical protein HQ596_00465, partial [Candidatus Saganbacteria bacterium]|nr:hypothetical protein [Candidatus Saganbacteria bacterium]
KVVHLYDRIFKTNYDLDGERGMREGEEYFIKDLEIKERLLRAGFRNIKKKYFWTQWALNHLFVASK